jgi:hypothetical protein
VVASYSFKDTIMKVKWSQLVLKIIVWLFAEMYLTVLGLDNLADYGEFVFQYKALLTIAEMSTLSYFQTEIILSAHHIIKA